MFALKNIYWYYNLILIFTNTSLFKIFPQVLARLLNDILGVLRMTSLERTSRTNMPGIAFGNEQNVYDTDKQHPVSGLLYL